MDGLNDFLDWAWARHHNPLSWYVRPLFILPFCYFAYQKNVRGIVLTLVALASSMFWFPIPATPDPRAVALLDVERRYVNGPMTLERMVLTSLVPIWFVALAWGVRRRSWLAVSAVISSGTLLKIAWLFREAGSNAWLIIPPVALGTAVCAGVLLIAYTRVRNQELDRRLIGWHPQPPRRAGLHQFQPEVNTYTVPLNAPRTAAASVIRSK